VSLFVGVNLISITIFKLRGFNSMAALFVSSNSLKVQFELSVKAAVPAASILWRMKGS
jgi:hypothetical protein